MKRLNNYVKLALVIFATVIIVIAACNLYRNNEMNKANTGYISKYVRSLNASELDSAVKELGIDSFIYISYVGDKEIYNFEKDLRKVLKKYNLEDNFIYVDYSDNITGSDLKEKLELTKNIKLPAILYYKDNLPVDYIDSSEGLINSGNFEKMLNSYEIGA